MISVSHILIFSLILFLLGFWSLMINKNILFIFISLEIMINSISVALVCISSYWNHIDGAILYILLITISAIELSINLLLLIQCYQKKNILSIDKLSEMVG
ncbi:NADH-quinone oxidoreductase subunit K [Buchnera aphidicola (Pterocallis alni)]|uniref:NADH-quinone oxidoreductase subunit NuoK n=1 Tax=Buchnera aphidicola TaxID=9 RepID=UPI00346455C1